MTINNLRNQKAAVPLVAAVYSMKQSKLPHITKDEEKGIELMHDFFDYGVDYTKGGPLTTEDKEKDRLINLGMQRFWAEEFEEL